MIVNFVHTVKEKLNEALDVSETSGIIAEVSIADFVLWSCTYTVIVVLKTTYLLLYYTGGCLPVGGVVCPGDVWQTAPPLTEFSTHACENITFPQLRLRTVINDRRFSKPLFLK